MYSKKRKMKFEAKRLLCALALIDAAEIQTHPWSNHGKEDRWDALYLEMTELPNGLWNRAVIHRVWSETVHRLWSEPVILDTFHRYDEPWRQENLWHGSRHQRMLIQSHRYGLKTITRHVHTAKILNSYRLWFSLVLLPVSCRWFWVKHLWNDLNEVLSSHLASRSISRRSPFKGICCNKGLRQWESAPLGALWDVRWTTCLSQSTLSAEPAPVAQFLT